MKDVKSQGMTCHVPCSSDSGIPTEESPEDASGSEHYGGGEKKKKGGGKERRREVAQSCLTLCDPMDYSLPCSSIHGVFRARVLEWGAIAFSSWARANS